MTVVLPIKAQICFECRDDLDIEPSIVYGWTNLADVDVEFRIGCKNEKCDFERTVYKKVSFTIQDMIDAEV